MIREGLYVGNEHDCRNSDDDLSIVHACKSPCHQFAVGYRKSLPKDHPNYLVLEQGADLYLNLVDPPIPLFMPRSFIKFLQFAQAQMHGERSILIHCNQGESRAPSLAMLLLAKVTGEVSNESYESARADFEALFGGFRPGLGIQKYLSKNWSEFDDF